MKTSLVNYALTFFLLGNINLWADDKANWPRFRGPNGIGTADFAIPAKS